MSVLVEEQRPQTRSRLLPADHGLAVLGCGEGDVTFRGRPGGIAVTSDGTVFVSLPASGTIMRLESGPALPASAGPIEKATGDAGRTVLAPGGLAAGPDGTLFVADTTGHRVWAISPSGEPRVVAGSTYGYRDGRGNEALFRYPSDVAIGPDGSCYVADAGNHCIRRISPEGVVTTLAGSIYDYGDGRGPDGRFREPLALDVDRDGTCYVADTGNNAVRRVTPEGEVTTLAGSPPGGGADGAAAEVELRWPTGIAVGHDGGLWVADHGNGALRRIERTGASTTALRLAGRRWPVAVALGTDGEVLLAAETIDDERHRGTCLMSAGAGR